MIGGLMDKSDWALILSFGSLISACASAFYTRRQSRLTARSMARKEPVAVVEASIPLTETSSGHPDSSRNYSREYNGYYNNKITIANMDKDHDLRALSVRSRMRHRIATYQEMATVADRPWDHGGLPETLDDKKLKGCVQLGVILRAKSTTLESSAPVVDKISLTMISTAPLRSSDLVLDWAWLDGSKRGS